MISVSSSGSFQPTKAFLKNLQKIDVMTILKTYGEKGKRALENATPVNSGVARASWGYSVSRNGGVYEIVWTNSDVEDGFPVVIMLQYGHGTGTGGYVQGNDFINPALRPIFDEIATEMWRAVTKA